MKIKNIEGFTLVELLITITLLSIIVLVSSQFLIELVSNSVRIQNKITLEQNVSFIDTKISKILSDADSVTFSSGTKIIYNVGKSSFALEYRNGILTILDLSKDSSDTKILNDSEVILAPVGSENVFESVGSAFGPSQVKFKLKLDIYTGSKLGATQNIERIITVRKSYKK